MFKQFIRLVAIMSLGGQSGLAPAVDTYSVQELTLGPVITLSGTVIPKKEITLTAQLPGRVEMIAGEEGDFFQEDEILVSIDATELKARRRGAYAELQNARAALRSAGIQYERELWSPDSPTEAPGGMGLPHLFDQFVTKPFSDILGQSDSGLDRRAQLHSYGTQIEQARNAILGAQAQIEQIDAKLRDAVGKAPFEGVIIKKRIEMGDTVQPGMPLLEFANTQQLQIEADIPARLVPGLELGETVTAHLDVVDTPVNVQVARIFPTADPQRHTITVKFDLPTEQEADFIKYVGPGQYVQVEIPEVRKRTFAQQVLVIPKASVIYRGSLPSVFVRQDEAQQELRLIRLGRSISAEKAENIDKQWGELVQVLSGLSVGETILVNPTPGLTSSKSTTPSQH
ncbi:MAG: efflux RND transporter periplasmic adaptor subunit [Pseudomonadota bacterium]|nr:efflux RND transporter periplasmic adaptor subunit [Pseudomonadota bacterium]